MAKSVCVTYLLWCFGGGFGLHHLYLGRSKQAFLWAVSFGGFFFGFLRDLFRIPDYVSEANEDDEYQKIRQATLSVRKKPKFSFSRFVGQIMFGSFFSGILAHSVPGVDDLEVLENFLRTSVFSDFDLGWIVINWLLIHAVFISVLSAFGAALGIYLVGNIGNQKGPMFSTFLATLVVHGVYFAYTIDENNVSLALLVGAIWFQRHREFDKSPRLKQGCCSRLFWFFMALGLFWSAVLSSVFFHAEFNIPSQTGDGDGDEEFEKVNMREAFYILKNSKVWGNIHTSWEKYKTFKEENGWEDTWERLKTDLNLGARQNALETLGLEEGATQAEIKSAYRKMALKWHPDKHPNNIDEAQIQFMKISEAYDILKQKSEKQSRRWKGWNPQR